jgi:hypothetical protein
MEALKMGDRLLIVGHSHWNRQFLADLLDVPEENWGLLSSSHTGLTALVRDAVDSPWRCLFLDDTSHLSSPSPEPLEPASSTDQPSPPQPRTPPLPKEE